MISSIKAPNSKLERKEAKMRSFILLTLFSVIGFIDQAVIDPGTNSDNKEVEDGSNELTEIDYQNIIEEDAGIDNNSPDSFNSDVNFGSTEESTDQHQNHSEGSSGNVHVPPNAIPYCYPYPYTNFQSPEERSMSKGEDGNEIFTVVNDNLWSGIK